MSLGEKIKSLRQKAGMSQEKLAEAIGVSRQAVTKWESDISSPNTDNLFRLAELFGITPSELLDFESEKSDKGLAVEIKSELAKEIYSLYKTEEAEKLAEKSSFRNKNIKTALLIAAGYLIIYFIGRIIWCDFSESSFMGWLIFAKPSGENSYLYGWLLSSGWFWIAMLISAAPALLGKHRFSLTTFIAFAAGLLAGIIFGPNPEGAAYGQGHYGWAIWGVIYFLSVAAGVVLERFTDKKQKI